VLEHLGQVALARLDAEMNRRGLGCDRLRKTVLRQEQAHHAFGAHLVDVELQAQRLDSAEMQTLVEGYVELADAILVEVSPLLESLDENAEAYRRALRRNLPLWTVWRAP
jgi:hypothetical protein